MSELVCFNYLHLDQENIISYKTQIIVTMERKTSINIQVEFHEMTSPCFNPILSNDIYWVQWIICVYV